MAEPTPNEQQRQAFTRWAADLPADEMATLLSALEDAEPVDGQVDLIAVTRDALDRIGLTAAEADRAIAAAFANPPNWREALT